MSDESKQETPEDARLKELIDEAEKISEQEKYEKFINGKILASGVPPEYMKYSFFDGTGQIGYNILDSNNKVNPTKQRALEITIDYIRNLKQNYQVGKSLFYYGLPSKKLGLSLLGTFILRAAVENRHSAKFVYFPTLCEDLGFGGDLESKDEYYEVDFLMIDSISAKSQANSKIIDGFADLILFRKKESKPTIFSSYISPEELASRYSESLMSYLDDFVVRIEIQHEDLHVGTLYDMDKLLKYLREKKGNKKEYTYSEIQSMIEKFINNYQFH